MFSAFKKLTNKNDVSAGGGQNGEGVHSMSHNLQKKFAKVSELLFFVIKVMLDNILLQEVCHYE